MSFGKRSVLILLFLLLCSALVLCGLAAAEYYTRSVGFGDDTPPIRLERDEAGGTRLYLHTLGIEKTYDLQPLVGFWESVKQFINENFGRGRNGSFVVPGGFLCRKM